MSDFLHDLHAEFFKWISCYYTARSNDPEIQDPHQSSSALLSWDGWLRINQFLGFTICLVSLFAVIWLIVEELLSLAPDSALRTWSQFKADFRFRHGALWLAAMLVSMPLLLMAVSPQSFG